jgi:hypothetical protein
MPWLLLGLLKVSKWTSNRQAIDVGDLMASLGGLPQSSHPMRMDGKTFGRYFPI